MYEAWHAFAENTLFVTDDVPLFLRDQIPSSSIVIYRRVGPLVREIMLVDPVATKCWMCRYHALSMGLAQPRIVRITDLP